MQCIMCCKREVVNTFKNYVISEDCYDNYKYVINFSSDNMVENCEEHSYKKLNNLCLTEIMIT